MPPSKLSRAAWRISSRAGAAGARKWPTAADGLGVGGRRGVVDDGLGDAGPLGGVGDGGGQVGVQRGADPGGEDRAQHGVADGGAEGPLRAEDAGGHPGPVVGHGAHGQVGGRGHGERDAQAHHEDAEHRDVVAHPDPDGGDHQARGQERDPQQDQAPSTDLRDPAADGRRQGELAHREGHQEHAGVGRRVAPDGLPQLGHQQDRPVRGAEHGEDRDQRHRVGAVGEEAHVHHGLVPAASQRAKTTMPTTKTVAQARIVGLVQPSCGPWMMAKAKAPMATT